MIVILKKEGGSSRWEYPDKKENFRQSRSVNAELFAEYTGEMSIDELTSNVNYIVVEHTGPIPTDRTERAVLMSVVAEKLPDQVLVDLVDFQGTPAGKLTAVRTLTSIYSNLEVDVFSAEFADTMAGLVAVTSLTQGESDVIIENLKFGAA